MWEKEREKKYMLCGYVCTYTARLFVLSVYRKIYNNATGFDAMFANKHLWNPCSMIIIYLSRIWQDKVKQLSQAVVKWKISKVSLKHCIEIAICGKRAKQKLSRIISKLRARHQDGYVYVEGKHRTMSDMFCQVTCRLVRFDPSHG